MPFLTLNDNSVSMPQKGRINLKQLPFIIIAIDNCKSLSILY